MTIRPHAPIEASPIQKQSANAQHPRGVVNVFTSGAEDTSKEYKAAQRRGDFTVFSDSTK